MSRVWTLLCPLLQCSFNSAGFISQEAKAQEACTWSKLSHTWFNNCLYLSVCYQQCSWHPLFSYWKKITMNSRVAENHIKTFLNNSYPVLYALHFLSLKFKYTHIFRFVWFQIKFSTDKNFFIKMNLSSQLTDSLLQVYETLIASFWTEKCLNCNCAVTLLLSLWLLQRTVAL